MAIVLYSLTLFLYLFKCKKFIIVIITLSINELEHRPHGAHEIPMLPRNDSTSEFMPVDDKEVEYFFASDASAVIEHTNRVIYLEVSTIFGEIF